MRAIAFLLILAAIGAGIYYFFIADSEAYKTYENFATALGNGDRTIAQTYAESDSVLGGAEQNRRVNSGGMPVDAFMGYTFARESETKNPDGTVTIVALESVRFDPPGVTSAMGGMISKYRQTATLSKGSGKWLVTSFSSDFVETRNWKGELQ
jgi:hypothetical protein